MAKLAAALCLSCASAMVYHNPTAVQSRRTGTSFLPVNCRAATQRKHLQNSSHARIAREARSTTLAWCPGTVPRRNPTSAAHDASSARGKSAGQSHRAGRGARSERPRARRETRASSRKREKTAPRRTRPSSAPRPATRSSRASSRRTRRTPGRTSTTSRRRFELVAWIIRRLKILTSTRASSGPGCYRDLKERPGAS